MCISICKYTGARGKSSTSDANAEYVAKIRSILNSNDVCWQTCELGKVDIGGGGTILFAKDREKFEVYNDFNSDLVNMFRCIKERPLSLLKALNAFPIYSRQEFNMLLEFLDNKEPEFPYMQSEVQVVEEFFDEQDKEQILKILNTKAEKSSLKASTVPQSAVLLSGGGVSFKKFSKNGSMPKLVSAEPKNTGDS